MENYKQDEKTTLRMGENNCKQSNWQKINLQNHASQKQLMQPNIKKKQATQSKKKKKSRPDISPNKTTYRWQTNTWKDIQHCSLL